MKTTSEYIDLIKAHSDELRTQFGVRTLRLFGSVSRGEQHEGSDVDDANQFYLSSSGMQKLAANYLFCLKNYVEVIAAST